MTPPEDLARSQLAAGLNVLFVSDHDSTANHAALLKIAGEGEHVAFIPGIELYMSPSWGHFNAYPLKVGARLAIDTSTAPISAVLQENAAKRHGRAELIIRYIPYGYFSSVAAGVAPGGFDGAFDLVEINSKRYPGMMRKYWRGYGTTGMKGGTITSPAAATRTTSGASSPGASAPSCTWPAR